MYHIIRRRMLLLSAICAAAGAFVRAPSASAQKHDSGDGGGVVVTGSFAESQFSVYRRAFHALESLGFELRAGLIDRGVLITLPQPSGEQYLEVMVQVDSVSDSTKYAVAARILDHQGRPLAKQDEPQTMAKVIIAETLMLHAITGGKDDTPADTALPKAPVVLPLVARHGYAYDESDPVKVGGEENGHEREVGYLSSLRGPAGQQVRYARLGSCCSFPWHGDPSAGRLDAWEVTYDGAPGPVIVYLDMYRVEAPHAPEGFTGGPPPQPVKPASSR
jgi:hypothetical protein